MEIHAHSFAQLVGYKPEDFLTSPSSNEAHGTTVLAVKYKDGIIILSDRRATIGSLIMYDQADKIVPLDDHTVIAISGSYARSMKVCRYLKHSFKFYRRLHLIEMSIEGKIQEISDSVAANVKRENGLGVFVPVVGCYDPIKDEFNIYFFDGAGAYFTHDVYASAGSGSERIKGIFEYITRTKKPWNQRELKDVLTDALRILDIAADLDSATGGFIKVPPLVRVIDREGNREIAKDLLHSCVKTILKGRLAS
jgi:proteasome beta subunit